MLRDRNNLFVEIVVAALAYLYWKLEFISTRETRNLEKNLVVNFAFFVWVFQQIIRAFFKPAFLRWTQN